MFYRNAAHAFISELREITTMGSVVEVRGRMTRELVSKVVQLERPTERCITVPGRRNDVFAAIAETMWVIGGRNDLAFLTHYLERAPWFSDDGLTWRAGYGPRLRNWNGTDQIAHVLKILRDDPESRRAVIVLYDPDRDFVDSKDIPCNNWLHFMIRNGQLNMNIAVRSNDIFWGFSGINTFEWSIVHEMLARWLGVEVGTATFFISSLHLYSDHDARADEVLNLFTGATGYEKGWRQSRFTTSWNDFDSRLSEWFDIESQLRQGNDVSSRIAEFPDPLLKQFLQMLNLRAIKRRKGSDDEVRAALEGLGTSDLAYAAHEHLFRSTLALDSSGMKISNELAGVDGEVLREAIIQLHRQKNAAYGTSWKKRGEQIGVVANIDRKVDRIEKASSIGAQGGETMFDTVADLFVYCLKYQTYLADRDPEVARQVFGVERIGPFSDDPEGFEELVRQADFVSSRDADEISVLVDAVVLISGDLDSSFESQENNTASDRIVIVRRLSDQSLALLKELIREAPLEAANYVNGIKVESIPKARNE